jgi:hypothetical protein
MPIHSEFARQDDELGVERCRRVHSADETEVVMRPGRALLAGVLALLLALPAVAAARAQGKAKTPAPADLSGVWILNPELSDDTRDEMHETMEGRGGGSGGGPPPMSPGGGRAGPPGGGPGAGGPSGADPQERMRALFEPAEEIWVTQTPAEIEVDEVYGRLRRFRPNGRKYKTDNGTAEIQSEWKDGQLRVKTERGRGAKEVETWELSPDGRRLTVRLRLEGGRMPEITLTRVYDRGEEKATEPEGR